LILGAVATDGSVIDSRRIFAGINLSARKMQQTTRMLLRMPRSFPNAAAPGKAAWIGTIVFLAAYFTSLSAGVQAATPELYRQSAYESPVTGGPDDLVLLAGSGLAADDTVVYRVIQDSHRASLPPNRVPSRSDEWTGTMPIVSSAGAPYSLTIRLPQAIRGDHAYELWVETVDGEWSRSIRLNDARPLWITPAQVYASRLAPWVPREIKIVGRNLQPHSGRSTQVAFVGPRRFMAAAIPSGQPSNLLDAYVARVRLPATLTPGRYRIRVSRDGTNWVTLDGQSLQVLADPVALQEFSVSDPQFGGCRPDDGADDTACVLRAIAAARGSGGTVYFGAGTWDLIDGRQPGLTAAEGIVVPPGVRLQGAGSESTRLNRHADWNAHAPTVGFTLLGNTVVTGFTFRDLQVYRPDDRAGPYLQIGEDWQQAASHPGESSAATASDIVITRNTFDEPMVAIGSGGLPIARLFITHNVFGAYHSALELTGDQYNMIHKYRLDDSVIDYNVFKPGSELDLLRKTGTIASELGAGHRLDFSGNTADGASVDYLYAPGDAKGWRAAFFWTLNNDVEQVLVSQNSITCSGDKIGDGEAISFDNNANTFGFSSLPTVVRATTDTVTVAARFVARQHNREVGPTYYVGHWVQVVSGQGMGQVRKVMSYSVDPLTEQTNMRVWPRWDVLPLAGKTRVAVGHEYWQLYALDNHIDNRQPLCQKSNRSRRAGGALSIWAQSADSVLAGNHQFDSDGIFVQQNYAFVNANFEAFERPCAGCTLMGSFNFFLDIRDNVIDGEYDWTDDCSRSGIGLGLAAASWAGDGPPPTVSFGVSVSHNSIRHADEQYGGAIAQVNTASAGAAPHSWPLSDNLLIHHNYVADIDGPRARAVCDQESHSRLGIAFPGPAISWRTVLYANSCRNVSASLGAGGVGTVKVCPSPVGDSCECP
jgi:hypothetical protein